MKEDPTIEQLKNIINDLTLSLEMWIEGYHFDENHISKQKNLIKRANNLIGKPNSIEDILKMSYEEAFHGL